MLPTSQGFDQYFGLPYSIDMWPFHPQNPETYPDLPLMRDTEVVALNSDPRLLTRQYTDEAMKFIRQNREAPFLLYVPYSLPHVPLFASNKFQGTTERGLYGDVVSEIDWSAGQIMAALKDAGIDDKTLVIFSFRTMDRGLAMGRMADPPVRSAKEKGPHSKAGCANRV